MASSPHEYPDRHDWGHGELALSGIIGVVWGLILSFALWSAFYLLLATVTRALHDP